jgi:NAD(P)-dependent dehydrogenase (short-subunit alcohol dehydrogenase family)
LAKDLMMAAFSLTDARVLIVGGSSGIGLATARMAVEHGAQVTLAARDATRLAQAVTAVGAGCTAHRLDTADDAAVETFFGHQATFDHVVVTAAKLAPGRVAELPMETALANFNSKFWGSYRIARAAKIVAGGSLTFVSGAGARRPRPGRAVAAAACAALEALTRALAVELAPVRVNCVSPGFTDTPMLRAAFPDGAPAPALATPAGRVGAAEEIAFQVLACAANHFMTGAIIDVDGGCTLV